MPESNHADWEWMKDAACKPDPDNEVYITWLFFPDSEKDPHVADAKDVCNSCGVQQECLKYAMDTRQVYGIWGGLTEEERRKLVWMPRR
jgi:WhiB family redox-sensing transcriptional regulator